MMTIRQPAVAGSFYPASAGQLKSQINQYIVDVKTPVKVPKAMIVPHAGYIYSGSVAGRAYARLHAARDRISRVVLAGPSHHIHFHGIAASSADFFSTPLGEIEVDRSGIEKIIDLPFVQYLDQAHEYEHALEVQLPFLQLTLDSFSIIPLTIGTASAEDICKVLEFFWHDAGTLIIISSDLSHYHDYQTAVKVDQNTTNIIEALQYERLDPALACGCVPISGLLALARKKHLEIKTVALQNSGDTAGNKNRVVGYGAYVIE